MGPRKIHQKKQQKNNNEKGNVADTSRNASGWIRQKTARLADRPTVKKTDRKINNLDFALCLAIPSRT